MVVASTDSASSIYVRVGAERVPVDARVFDLLFENSHRRTHVPVLNAQASGSISLKELAKQAHAGQIPLPLFFAPLAVAQAQVDHKTKTLLAGTSKDAFSMNSRSAVCLADVELIVKDLLRKQELLKRLDSSLTLNTVIGRLRSRTQRTVVEDANRLRDLLAVNLADLRSERTKSESMEYLIRRFEQKQLLVSRNQPNYMLQIVPPHVTFSGLAVKDPKVPYLFLATGDEKTPEPAGRKIFTLALLATLVGYGRFAPVTYEDRTTAEGTRREYEVAAEMLMPTTEVKALRVRSLDEAEEHAEAFRVTPSAFVVRAWRAGVITGAEADKYLATLRRQWNSRPKERRGGTPTALNAVRSYCGREFFDRMVRQLAIGRINPTEFNRSVCLNKLPATAIQELRAQA